MSPSEIKKLQRDVERYTEYLKQQPIRIADAHHAAEHFHYTLSAHLRLLEIRSSNKGDELTITT